MINSIVLLRAFDSNYVANVFNHANDLLLSHTVGADRTNITIGNIKTTLTKFYFTTHFTDYFTELRDIVIILLEQVQYEA